MPQSFDNVHCKNFFNSYNQQQFHLNWNKATLLLTAVIAIAVSAKKNYITYQLSLKKIELILEVK